jgi:uncharacterized SAM-binding protein YcdF (DUF218 family)
MARFPIVQKKEKWTLTWRGRLLFLLLLVLLVVLYMKTIVTFLSPYEPAEARILVVEGYMPDYALEEAMQIYHDGSYELMLITGKKREKGAHLDQYSNDGLYSEATLIKLGFDASRIRVIAQDQDVKKDRTYYSALAVKEWLDANRPGEQSIDLVSMGTHSRRSRLLFKKAFDGTLKIGIHTLPNKSYDPRRWWQSSHGFREVNKETIAWIYARFFFYP